MARRRRGGCKWWEVARVLSVVVVALGTRGWKENLIRLSIILAVLLMIFVFSHH